MLNKNMGENLRRAREKKGWTQVYVAKLLGMTSQALSNYERGERDPDTPLLNKLAELYGVPTDYFFGRNLPLLGAIPVGPMVKIPVIGTVKAGPNGVAFEEPLGYELADEKDVNHGANFFYLKVRGDSMIGEGILPGDLALVREQPEVEYGELAVVVVDGEEGTLKRVYKHEDGILLQGANPAYKPRVFVGKDLERVKIIGRVRKVVRNY